MSQRLVKVAKELNVGTDSIVEYLSKKGFVIEAKPTSMISDEMHNLLLQEFSGNIAIKEQADSMVTVSYTHLRAHETVLDLVCRLLLEKKQKKNNKAIRSDYHSRRGTQK